MKRRLPPLRMITIISMIAAMSTLVQPAALAEPGGDEAAAENAYRAYIQAWKTKDMAALQNLISDDYMAVNFENKVSSKEIEIATAKNDAAWDAMSVDEIHARLFGNTAILRIDLGARKKSRRHSLQRESAIPGGSDQAQRNMATCGHTVVRGEASAAQSELSGAASYVRRPLFVPQSRIANRRLAI